MHQSGTLVCIKFSVVLYPDHTRTREPFSTGGRAKIKFYNVTWYVDFHLTLRAVSAI